jgi:tetratricopeptide (TPR) repeat protein
MNHSSRHLWIRGGSRSERQALIRSLFLPPAIVPNLDAHRRLGGPYTAAGSIARALAPAVVDTDPDLIRRYDIELLSVAPELSTIVPNSRQTLTSMAIPKEGTRFYARLRTRRIANGLVEFVRDSLPEGEPRCLVVDNVEHADPTDLEFLAALVRRIDPARLTIVICTGHADPPDAEMFSVLATHAETDRLGPSSLDQSVAAHPAGSSLDRRQRDAWAYVATECTADEARSRRAYEALSPGERAELHDRRAAELAELDSHSWRLGAIPFHLERGTDPAGAGAQALYAAQHYCLGVGFYSAVVDYGYRALEIIDARLQPGMWWMVTVELTQALSILSRTRQAEQLYDQARLLSTDPTVHMAAAYATAMLYTRPKDPEGRDEEKAKSWLNSAIATASLLADPSERAFQSALYQNGLALVEVNLGEPADALRLVNECIDRLDRELPEDDHRLHKSVLQNNRARVLASLGRLDEALADYEVVIREDPNHAEHYLERGNILRRLDRTDEAFADYATAIRLSPPFPEIYYDRGDLRLATDDIAGALADFSYVLDLDPDFVDAYVNRAGLYLQAGQLDEAGQDAAAGLRRDPVNPRLWVVAGYVHLAHQEYPEAAAAFEHALAGEPGLIAALSGRAQLAHQTGRFDDAIADLGRAVALDPADAALRYNRAFALQSAGRWDEALGDLAVAADLAPDDPQISAARDLCLQRVAA